MTLVTALSPALPAPRPTALAGTWAALGGARRITNVRRRKADPATNERRHAPAGTKAIPAVQACEQGSGVMGAALCVTLPAPILDRLQAESGHLGLPLEWAVAALVAALAEEEAR